MTKIVKLEYREVLSAGKQIHATFTRVKDDKVIFGTEMIATEPFRQFPNAPWDGMIRDVFFEMVQLWNKYYAENEIDERDVYEKIDI